MEPKTQTHYRTCSLCEAMCGVAIEHDGEKVLSIKGDKNDPFSRGHICPKAAALQDLHEDPNRLKFPLKRTEQGFQQISWNEAFDIVANKIKTIQKQHGYDSVATYSGNPNVHNYGSLAMLGPFLSSLRTTNRFSATSVDQLPHMFASMLMFGHQALLPVPDVDRCDYFFCLGANPLASNGSVMSCADLPKRLKDISKHGKLLVVDPRKTETAAIANEHLFIKPGSDSVLLLAIVNEVFQNNWVKLRHLSAHTDGLTELETLAKSYTAEFAAFHTGIAAEHIQRIAKEYALSEHGVIYARIGVCAQQFGTLTLWLVYALNIITGHFDREGGYMFSRPAIDIVGVSALMGMTGSFNRHRSRVRNLPEFGGEFPVAELADNILSDVDDRIRALVTIMGNPVLSLPNGKKMDQAFEKLDFMVAIDFYLNETTQHADIILPTTGPLEHAHFDFVLQSVAVRNTVKWSEPLFKPAANTKHDWEVLLELTTRINSRSPASTLASKLLYQTITRLGLDQLMNIALLTGPYGWKMPGLGRLVKHFQRSNLLKPVNKLLQSKLKIADPIQTLLATTPYNEASPHDTYLSLTELKKHPNGIDLGPLTSCMPDRIHTPNQRLQLVPTQMLEGLQHLQNELASASEQRSESNMSLIGRRHLRSNNSWLHNSYRLVKGKNRCTAQIHPSDANRLKVEEGALVKICSSAGAIEIPVEITENIMPGVISVPHGWGHNRSGINLTVAQAHAGVSINDVVDDHWLDPLSGMSALNGGTVVVHSLIDATRKAAEKTPPQ